MGIPVVVVDDSEIDRYVVKRRLSRVEGFEEVREASAGDTFLEDYFNGHEVANVGERTLLVLMDINMPRMNGFETIEAMEALKAEGKGPANCMVLMFSSSDNPDDRAKAKRLESVKGYIVKPFQDDDVDLIRRVYERQ